MRTDRKSGVGRGESGDRQGVCSGEGTVWGVWGSGVGVDGVVREEEDWEERGQDEGQSRKGGGIDRRSGGRRQDWETRREGRKRSGVGGGVSGDRQEEEWGGRGRE